MSWIYFGMWPGVLPWLRFWWQPMFAVAFFTAVAQVVLYSKHELNDWQVLIRHSIHFLMLVVIVAVADRLFGFFAWGDFVRVAVVAASVAGIYAVVLASEYLRSKWLARKLTQAWQGELDHKNE